LARPRLIHELRRSAYGDVDVTRFCPSDEIIAGFVDGGLDDDGHRSVQNHLHDCPACVQRVGSLVRFSRDAGRPIDVDADGNDPEHRRRAHWAVAASVLLAFGWMSWVLETPDSGLRETRNTPSLTSPPEILAPSSGVFAQSGTTLIRWTEVAGATAYDVRIVNDIGDILVSRRVEQAFFLIDDELGLEPGLDYYIRIDARLSSEYSIQSEHIRLRMSPP
jgi:hypothetical protein